MKTKELVQLEARVPEAKVTLDFGDEKRSYMTTFRDAVRYGAKFNKRMRKSQCPYRCRITFEP